MNIQKMFAKPIDRSIKGVIKVGQDDNENIRQELEEYVVTRELQKHFSEFFSSYKRGITGNTDAMGVWISGFFGKIRTSSSYKRRNNANKLMLFTLHDIISSNQSKDRNNSLIDK